MSEKVHIDELLKSGQTVQFTPQGYSMYPVIVPGRDFVIVRPVEPSKLKRGDVALYRRYMDGNREMLVLHRVWKHNKKGIFMLGDNESLVEGPLKEDQFYGIMQELIRKKRHIPVQNVLYVILTRFWLLLRPLRPAIAKTVHFFKKGKKI